MAWVKGQSGNPSGKPRGYADMQALARGYTELAIKTLVAALADDRLKVHAAEALLDRGWGKPAQTQILENSDGTPLSIVVMTSVPALSSEADEPAAPQAGVVH